MYCWMPKMIICRKVPLLVLLSVLMWQLSCGHSENSNSANEDGDSDAISLHWKGLFDIDDLDHDGKITVADRQERVNLFMKIYNKANRGTEQINAAVKEVYDEAFFRFARKGARFVTKDELINGVKKALKENPEQFVEDVRYFERKYMSLLDLNGDRKLSWGEHKAYLEVTLDIGEDKAMRSFLDFDPSYDIQQTQLDDDVTMYDSNEDNKLLWTEYKIYVEKTSGKVDESSMKQFLSLDPSNDVDKLAEYWTKFLTEDDNGIIQREMENGFFNNEE